MLKQLLKINNKFGAQNYKPLPIIIKEGKNIFLKDINGTKYYDYLSAYSSVNQGHCHPRLSHIMSIQSKTLTLTSRAFHNENLINFYKYIHEIFRYDKCLMMNTGVEAAETAIKLARLWGYKHKNIKPNKAQIIVANNNFWGRTITACSTSNDPLCYNNFGPYTPGFLHVEFNNFHQLKTIIKNNNNIAAFMVEPIQGEAGIIIPDDNYLKNVKKLCKKNNILLICDEIQTGLGRTGHMLASQMYGIKPDILILGKALSGGMMPISTVLANNNIMKYMKPGMHGSTYGGNPLAAKLAMESINILIEEKLVENAEKMGQIFRRTLNPYKPKFIKDIRGKGLLNAIEFYSDKQANDFVINCSFNGLLTKTTHGSIVRMSPPLTITRDEMYNSLEIITDQILKMSPLHKYHF